MDLIEKALEVEKAAKELREEYEGVLSARIILDHTEVHLHRSVFEELLEPCRENPEGYEPAYERVGGVYPHQLNFVVDGVIFFTRMNDEQFDAFDQKHFQDNDEQTEEPNPDAIELSWDNEKMMHQAGHRQIDFI